MKRIAMLGSGAMGTRVAQNLLKAGHAVVVYSRTAEKAQVLLHQGATYASTPRRAAEQADVVIAMVTDDEASQAVWLHPETGAIGGLQPGAIALESSTLTVAWTQKLAAKIETTGTRFIDAPVVGSRPQAEAGQLIYLVGGTADKLAAVQEILLATGKAVHLVGSVGQGMAMKLAVNTLFGIQVAALAEALGWLTRQGLTMAQAWDCLSTLPVMSPAAKGVGGLMVAHRHAPQFPIELVEKDLRYALASAQTVDAQIPTAIVVQQIFRQAIAKNYGSHNISGVIQLFV